MNKPGRSAPSAPRAEINEGVAPNRSKAPSKLEFRIALGLAATLLFAVVLSNTFLNNPLGYDFSAMYASGLIVRQGRASQIYDLKVQAEVEKDLGRNRLLVYAQPPFETLLFSPLTNFSYPMAYILWGAINVFLWVLFQHLLRPAAPVPGNPYHYLMLCSLFFPLWVALMQGQMAVLLLLMFTLAFVHFERSCDYRAGVFLGLGLFKFPVVLPFALICLFCRKWKLMAGFTTAASFLAGLSLLTAGPAGIFSYIRMLTDALANPGKKIYAVSMKPSDMATLRGLFMTLCPNISPHSVQVAAGIAGIILLLATAWVWRRRENRPGKHSSGPLFAGAIAVSLVASPHTQVHDMTLMLLAILLVLGSRELASNRASRSILYACIGILYFPPAYVLMLKHHILPFLCPVLVCFAVTTLYLATLTSPVRGPEALKLNGVSSRG